MVDSGWLAVAGAVAGGTVAGAIALLQARHQHRFDMQKLQHEREWRADVVTSDRDHLEATRRHEQLMQIYTRYQVAADRLENAARELGQAVQADEAGSERATPTTEGVAERLDTRLEVYEAAQAEYDEICEIIKLAAPSTTIAPVLQQRQMLNRLVKDALQGVYDHDANYPAIVKASEPVLSAMRSDLGTID